MRLPNAIRAFSSKIYTRTGDTGTTFLNTQIGRIPKYSLVFQVLGDNDELSSSIGVSREFIRTEDISNTLVDIQHRLQDINSIITTHPFPHLPHLPKLLTEKTVQLEKEIDTLTGHLEPLRNFIIPSGGTAASHLHLSRAICRRAERSLCQYLREREDDDRLASAEIYLNRLSDFLFTAARYCAKIEGTDSEAIYSSRTTK